MNHTEGTEVTEELIAVLHHPRSLRVIVLPYFRTFVLPYFPSVGIVAALPQLVLHPLPGAAVVLAVGDALHAAADAGGPAAAVGGVAGDGGGPLAVVGLHHVQVQHHAVAADPPAAGEAGDGLGGGGHGAGVLEHDGLLRLADLLRAGNAQVR